MPDATGQDAFDLIELQGLHSEVNTRILIQNLCIIVTAPLLLAAVAAMLAWPGQAMLVALVFLVATGVAALIWCHNGVRQAQIKTYLLMLAARHSRDGGWEHWLPAGRTPGLLGNRWFVATKGSLIGVQATALAAAVAIGPASASGMLALGLGLWAATIWLLLSNPKEGVPPASP